MPVRPVRITYLELRSPAPLGPEIPPPPGAELVHAEMPSPELNRFFYATVGADYHWTDRLSWSRHQWLELLEAPRYETWLAMMRGTPAGYFELDLRDLAAAEIVYFGLLPAFAGLGLGRWLLDRAVRRGFEAGAARVWLHTCSLDHPAALPNYLARGFSVFKIEEQEREVPDLVGFPWPS
jgi:GNAT superfamily N-acetyltransferase